MSLTGRPFLRRGPSGPLAPKLGLIQCGYDQPIKTQVLPTAGPTTTIPRDVALAPLQVQLPGVVPGNVLEVDFNLNLPNGGDDPVQVAVFGVVSFDGTTVLAPASSFFFIDNSQTGNTVDPGRVGNLRSLTAVIIPASATIATVQLFYITDTDGLSVAGTDAPFVGFPGSTLKASEIAALSVPQPGPSTLIPF